MKRLSIILKRDFKQFKEKASYFYIIDKILFRRAKKRILLRVVINELKLRIKIIRKLYDKLKYHEKKETYLKIVERYY